MTPCDHRIANYLCPSTPNNFVAETHGQKPSIPQHIFLSSCLCIFSLIHISTLLTPATSYNLPDHYFINCGSPSPLTVYYGKPPFAADEFFSGGDAAQAEAKNSSSSTPPPLYRNARVFFKPSSYEFRLNETGIYVVRFHFSPSRYAITNLHEPRFSVSALGFSLLPNLDFVNVSGSTDPPLVEEFLIKADAGKLRVEFRPKGVKSFAFINAIELFLAPSDFIQGSPPHVTEHGEDGDDKVLGDEPLRVVHRINVGGEDIPREMDTLSRYWVPDDPYLILDNMAKNTSYTGKIEYQSGGSTPSDAPEPVYNTAKVMNIDEPSLISFNITWKFGVGKLAHHLIRLHFCDIVQNTSNEQFRFNLYIYSGLREVIYPYGVIAQLAAPFYKDFDVYSDNSGFINISIGPHRESQVQTAFLNGVEIMEMIQEQRSSIQEGKKLLKFVCWGIGVVVLIVVILSVSILYLRKMKCKGIEEVSEWAFVYVRGGSTRSKTSRTSRTTARSVTGSVHADLNLGLKIPLSAILFATRKFNPRLMIGEGGFGKVYKGKMRDGRKVAVKRSEAGHGQGIQEFHTEIMVLSKIRHHHLVSLIGYCDEKNEMILVYEFMENGSLRDHLYISHGVGASSSRFSWEQRLKVCIGAARGLHYLHTGCKETIVHRDIKSTNILLDEEFVAKVSDFGLSRLGSLEQSYISTEVKGSFGYLDPEYYSSLQLTQKSDVYSFGVVLLEVVCARAVVDTSLPKEQVSLVDWGLSWLKKGQLGCIVDPFLVGKINPKLLRIFGETVERCLKESGGDRPYMSDVLWCLEYCLQFQNSGVPRQLYEDSTTDVSLGIATPIVRRLPSNSMSISEDEVAFRYCSHSDGSELGAR